MVGLSNKCNVVLVNRCIIWVFGSLAFLSHPGRRLVHAIKLDAAIGISAAGLEASMRQSGCPAYPLARQ